ncbi:hypothetical protein HY025_02045 [Candidatus Daviesbacteria bacterium]|nr:hypothetical protein [Candidatus Daviesbacteria bacterium]
MKILPIRVILDEEKEEVGINLVNLAKLKRLGFPISDGIVVFPPDLSNFFKKYQSFDKGYIERNYSEIKKELFKLTVPDSLIFELKDKLSVADLKKIWQKLLENWLNQIKIFNNLSIQPIIFSSKIIASGTIYESEKVIHQKIIKDSNLEIKKGELKPRLLKELDELVIKMDRILGIPQIYHFIVEEVGRENIIKIVSLIPSTPEFKTIKDEILNSEIKLETKMNLTISKSSTKLFIKASKEILPLDKSLDGFLMCSEDFLDFEEKVTKLIDLASFNNISVIFKLFDDPTNFNVNGTLRLLNGETILKKDVEAFLFARNKKQLLNIDLAIPQTRSVKEFLEIKRQVASLGVTRKRSLKFWLEMAIPENLLNLPEYLEAGLDGVIINLDLLQSYLGGFNISEPERVIYNQNYKAILNFIEEALKTLQKNHLPVLAFGNLTFKDEVLDFLVSKGVWGVTLSLGESHNFYEHLVMLEKRVLNQLIT